VETRNPGYWICYSGDQSPIILTLSVCQAELIRLRQNTPQLDAGMIGLRLRLRPDKMAGRTAATCLAEVMTKSEALQSEAGLATTQFRFDTPQLAAGSFIMQHIPFYIKPPS